MPLKTQSCARPRGGFSLIEVMVAVALSALLLGVVVSLMLGLQQWDRLTRTHSLHSEQIFRLADALRSDLRRASDVSIADDGPLVVTSPGGRETRYELGPDGCRRTVAGQGDRGPRVERFAIGRAAKWQLERKAMGRRPLVAVTIEPDAAESEPDAHDPRWAPLLVYAALGADLVESADFATGTVAPANQTD